MPLLSLPERLRIKEKAEPFTCKVPLFLYNLMMQT